MGDPEDRFAALFRTHYPEVVRFAARRAGPDQARDVAAETFLIAWRRFTEIPGEPDQVLPWLYAVARNTLANEQRGSRRRLRLGARIWSATGVPIETDHADAVVETMHVREALGSLAARDRETLGLVAWEGLDIAAAASVVGCTPKAFAVRLHRARRRLDRALADRASPERADHRPLEAKEARP